MQFIAGLNPVNKCYELNRDHNFFRMDPLILLSASGVMPR
jgi:hypothetical protein